MSVPATTGLTEAAEEMQRTAALMRGQAGPADPRRGFWAALAHWLDSVAYRHLAGDDEGIEPSDWNGALEICRAYRPAFSPESSLPLSAPGC